MYVRVRMRVFLGQGLGTKQGDKCDHVLPHVFPAAPGGRNECLSAGADGPCFRVELAERARAHDAAMAAAAEADLFPPFRLENLCWLADPLDCAVRTVSPHGFVREVTFSEHRR